MIVDPSRRCVPAILGPSLRGALAVAVSVAWLAFVAASWSSAQVLPREVRVQILRSVVEVVPYDPVADGLVDWSGSGTIISPDGYVLTNYHVIGDLDARSAYEWHAIFVTDPAAPDQPPEHSYWARFVAGDATHDLALVRIVEFADESPVPASFEFPAVPVGDSNGLIPGDPLTVVGYPGISGATITFTTGIVSGWLGEDLIAGGKQWIKTDAKIARGNSGGAAFDERGRLVGVPTLLQQRNDGVFEEQFYLRPIALAWALIGPNVASVQRPARAAGATGAPDPGSVNGGAAQSGVLTEGDERFDEGMYFDVYEVPLRAGLELVVEMRSTEIDPYLLVVGPDDELVLDVDDSDGQGFDVLESFTTTADGVYLLVASSAFADETGSYDLRLRAAPGSRGTDAAGAETGPAELGGIAPPAVGSATGLVGEIALPDTAVNRLAGSDDSTYHTYWIEVPPGTARLEVLLSAEADLDLFLKYGSEILDWGDDGDWDFRDISTQYYAEFVVENPNPGRWYLDVVLFGNPGTEPGYSVRVR